MTDLQPLCAASRGDVPHCCGDCVFWQHRTRTVDPDAKRRWAREMEESFGAWGRVLSEDGRFRGMLQYGPAGAFPRARDMPAGPPSRDAVLITCTYVTGDDPRGACERLILEALADAKTRDLAAVEAFALNLPDTDSDGHFDEHHTLFERPFLERLGFFPVRSAGQVSLMRIPLGGLISAEVPSLATRVTAPLKALWPLSAPSPVTMRRGGWASGA